MVENTPPDNNQTPDLSDYVPKADVEKTIKERLAQAKKAEAEKYADYADLKAAAAKLADMEKGQQTELEKIIARAEKAEAERDELNGKIETYKARKEALKKAKGLFEEGQIRSEGWEILEDLIRPGDDEAAIAEKLEKVKRAVGVKDVGSSGRTPPPATSKAPTVKEQLAAEQAKPKPDQLRIIQLRGRIAAGDRTD